MAAALRLEHSAWNLMLGTWGPGGGAACLGSTGVTLWVGSCGLGPAVGASWESCNGEEASWREQLGLFRSMSARYPLGLAGWAAVFLGTRWG